MTQQLSSALDFENVPNLRALPLVKGQANVLTRLHICRPYAYYLRARGLLHLLNRCKTPFLGGWVTLQCTVATLTRVCRIINYLINFEDSILTNDIFSNISSDSLFPKFLNLFLGKFLTFLKINIISVDLAQVLVQQSWKEGTHKEISGSGLQSRLGRWGLQQGTPYKGPYTPQAESKLSC